MGANLQTDFISLRNDLLFHMVFTRNSKALNGLIRSLLNLPEDGISGIEVLNPMQYSESTLSKLTVLDLKVHLDAGRYVLVEMQVRRFDYWTNRTMAYACRQVADQVVGDFDYGKMEPVIQVSIMDHSLFPDHRRFFSRYLPKDEEGYLYSDMLQFYVMDLTQLESATEEQFRQGLVEWGRIFRANSWAEIEAIENPGVKEASKTMQFILSNPTERELIRTMMDAEIDHRTQIRAAESRGETRGIELGKKLGEAHGKTTAHQEDARRMKEDGMSPEIISKYTGLTLQDIASL